MSATLDAIDAAILAALQTLRSADPLDPTPSLPFAYVGRYRGEVTREYGVDRETLGVETAALLALEGEAPEARQRETRTILKGSAETVARSLWRVYVVVQRPDSADDSLKGDGTDLGVYALVDRTVSVLHGLPIAGLYQGERLRWLDTRPHLILPGQVSVYLVRLEAVRPLTAAPVAMPAGTKPFAGVTLDINSVGTSDPAPNPLTQARVEL